MDKKYVYYKCKVKKLWLKMSCADSSIGVELIQELMSLLQVTRSDLQILVLENLSVH